MDKQRAVSCQSALPKLLLDGTLRLAKTFMRAFVRLATHMLKGICRQLCVATHDMNVLANMGGCPSPWFAFWAARTEYPSLTSSTARGIS